MHCAPCAVCCVDLRGTVGVMFVDYTNKVGGQQEKAFTDVSRCALLNYIPFWALIINTAIVVVTAFSLLGGRSHVLKFLSPPTTKRLAIYFNGKRVIESEINTVRPGYMVLGFVH